MELGQDAVGAGPAVVVDPVVAIPAGPSIPELHQPRPDLLGRGRDGDRSGGAGRVGDEVVAGHGAADLLIRGPPAVLPGLGKEPIGAQNGQGSERADGQSKPAKREDQQDGDHSMTVFFNGCPGADVTVERVVQLTSNRLLWVQVRSQDRATANRVLESVTTYGI